MELTNKEKRILQIFSMHIRSHGSDKAKLEWYLGAEAVIDYPSYDWGLEKSSIRVEGYDAINELIESIVNKINIDSYIEYSTDDISGGAFYIMLDAKEKVLSFKLYYSIMQNESSSNVIDFEEFGDSIEPLKVMAQKYKSTTGTVDYEGSGDSGWVEDKIYINNKRELLPDGIEDVLYDNLESNFGGWEINEGSSGQFIFDFDNETVEWTHNQNYEENYHADIPIKINF